ncbi:MAG TPA: pitrilysin family protein [Vicinamibacterales bacterium]|nr:pitrilysin family protein [Vicinamibacterales bacterium]
MRVSRASGALIVLFVALAITASAQEKPAPAGSAARTPAAAPVPDIPYTKFVLKNGLTLLVHEDHKAPIVAVNVWYHVGSKNEKPGKTGFAHLFEHLMFNGSEHFNDDYFKAVEPVGATDLNGTTNEDRTNYFQNVPVSALDRILWLESDRMGHLLGVVTQARLDEQRGVVQNEKRQSENEPYGKSWITIAENTFPQGHPYSWSVIGSMEDLSAASLEDVKEWFRTYYGPSNATIVLAGDIDPETARQKVERHFGGIPPGPPVIEQDTWIARPTGPHRQRMQDRVPQARIYKVWNVPPFGSKEATQLSLVGELLAGGRSSRLYKRLVYKDRIATDVNMYFDDREIASQLYLLASAQPGGDLRAVERALDEELAKLIASGPTAEELERVKTEYRANFVRGVERIGGFGGKSDVLARGQVYLGNPDAYRDQLTFVQDATAASLQALAKEWLDDRAYVLEVEPFPPLTTTTTNVDRSKLPEVGPPPSAPLPAFERATLSNGLKVLLVRRTAVPVVQLSMLLDAGFAADDPDAPGVSSMAMAMLPEGTTKRSALEIADEAASLGAQLSSTARLDVCQVGVSVLRDKLDPALDLYSDLVLRPTFPETELTRVKRNRLARIQQEKVQPFSMALRVLPGLLYGADHAYGQPLTGTGTEASVKAMTREDLARFHSTWFKPNHATLIAVGDVTLAELTPKLEKAFGAWKQGDVPKKNIAAVSPRSGNAVYILDRPGAEQSVILVGTVITPKSNPDEFAFQMFNEAFGGAFTSRVNMNLREDKHWSYGAGSVAFDARGQRPWIMYAPVQTDKTKESMQELVKELRDVTGGRPLSAQELTEAKDRQTRTLAGRWETGRAIGGAIEEIVTFGLPEDYYQTFAEKVHAVTVPDVTKALAKTVVPDRTVWVVIGDRAKIEAGVRELKLGEVRALDADGKPLGTM